MKATHTHDEVATAALARQESGAARPLRNMDDTSFIRFFGKVSVRNSRKCVGEICYGT